MEYSVQEQLRLSAQNAIIKEIYHETLQCVLQKTSRNMGRGNMKMKRLLALMLLILVCLPCQGLALGDYDGDAMDEYCDLWTVYYDNENTKIDLSASLGITAWAHGTYDGEHTIAQMLRSETSPATLMMEAEASFDDDEYTILMVDEYLSEIPQELKLEANGKMLTSSYSTGSSATDFHYFDFDADEMMDVIDYLLDGGTATFHIRSSKGSSTAEISEAKTPKIVAMMKHTRNGRWYSNVTTSRFKSSSLLPPGPRITPTPRPTPKSNIPSSLQGITLSVGDEGNKVRIVKEKMQDLGYYRATATVDGRFNDMMVERLKQFQKNNGLRQTGSVDSATLEKLYSSSPVKGQFYVAPTPTPKPEGRYMLVIPSGGNGQWKKASGDKLQMRVQVKNESRYRTVEAFELYIYTLDIWGDRDPEDGRVYTSTTVKDVAPGKTVYSDYFVVPNLSMIDRVYVGVKQIRYDDGEIEEVSDYAVDYFYWTF